MKKLVSYAAVLSVVTQRGGALRDDTENGWVGDYEETAVSGDENAIKNIKPNV